MKRRFATESRGWLWGVPAGHSGPRGQADLAGLPPLLFVMPSKAKVRIIAMDLTQPAPRLPAQ